MTPPWGAFCQITLTSCSNKSRQDSLLAVSVKWISVNVNMFAIHYLSQIRHSHWYCVLTQCSLLSIIGLIVWPWFTPPNNLPPCGIRVRGCCIKTRGYNPLGGLAKSLHVTAVESETWMRCPVFRVNQLTMKRLWRREVYRGSLLTRTLPTSSEDLIFPGSSVIICWFNSLISNSKDCWISC